MNQNLNTIERLADQLEFSVHRLVNDAKVKGQPRHLMFAVQLTQEQVAFLIVLLRTIDDETSQPA